MGRSGRPRAGSSLASLFGERNTRVESAGDDSLKRLLLTFEHRSDPFAGETHRRHVRARRLFDEALVAATLDECLDGRLIGGCGAPRAALRENVFLTSALQFEQLENRPPGGV